MPNQLFSQRAFHRPEAAELMTQYVISSHLQHASRHAPFTQATLSVRGNHHLISATKTSGMSAPTQVPLWGHRQKRERAEYRLALNQHTSTHIPEVRCQVLQWLTGLSVQHPPAQWQGGGSLLSGCFCCLQETEDSLPHPLATQVALDFTLLSLCCFSCHSQAYKAN